MIKDTVIQRGDNSDYPKKATIWKIGDPIPEWLSDRAKVSGMNSNGEPFLEMRNGKSGNIEIMDSGGRSVLVKLKDKNSYVLFSSTHPIISLTEHQLKLLYK